MGGLKPSQSQISGYVTGSINDVNKNGGMKIATSPGPPNGVSGTVSAPMFTYTVIKCLVCLESAKT